MNLYESIFTRKSVRKYSMEPLREEFLEHLRFFTRRMQALNPEIGVDFQILDNTKKEPELKGIFQVKAPYYLVLSSELMEGYLENAGYLMQQICLYLNARMVGSCYQGGVKPNAVLKSKLKYDYVIALAFGEAKGELYREAKKAKRLSEKETSLYKEEVSDTMRRIMKAARLAPSAMNAQPWRLVVYQNRIHVFCKKGFFKKAVLSDWKLLDIGIMLSNLTQAAEEFWLNVTMTKLDNISEKSFKNNEYMISVLLKDNSF